jgi:integrase
MGQERIHGPYKHRNKYRVIEVRGDGQRAMVSFETEAEALKYVAAVKKVAIGRSVGEAVTDYLQYLRGKPARRGGMRRESTLELNRSRLVGFLQLPEGDRPLGTLTPQYARKLFDARAAEVKPDTMIAELATVERWMRYCVDVEGWLPKNPFTGLQVVGELSTGKPQLREDEARRFLATALLEGSQGGLAAALALLTGMRASEVTGLTVRDLDSGGTVLWVADNAVRKLKNRKMRRLQVPTVLQHRLRSLAGERSPEERLFHDPDCKNGVHRYWLYNHVERLCGKAGVPRVSPHGLRGTFATLAREVMPTEKVAATIGNLPRVSATNYIEAGAAESADAARLAATLGGTDATDVQVDNRNRDLGDVGGGRVRRDGRQAAQSVDEGAPLGERGRGSRPGVDPTERREGSEGNGLSVGASVSAGPGRETDLGEKFPSLFN